MKLSLRLAAAVLALAPVFAAAQQGQTIAYGRTTLHYSAGFQQTLGSLGLTVTDLYSNPLPGGTAVFPITEGVVDLQTGVGEVTSSGGNLFLSGANVIKLQNLVLDLSNPATPMITGIFVVNGLVLPREPIFNLQLPAGFTLPLTPQNGVEAVSGFGATLAPAAVATVNHLFGGDVLQNNIPVGTVDLYTVLAVSGSN